MFSRLRSLLRRENVVHPETRERRKEAGIQPQRTTGLRKWFCRRQKTAMEPSSHPTLRTKKEVKKEIERLTTALQLATAQRNQLRDRLLFITEGTVDNRPYHQPNPFYEKLRMEHKRVMKELNTLQNENTEASKKFSEQTKETLFYRGLHSRLLMEQTQLEKKVGMLRQEKMKLLEDWVLLKHHSKELRVICEDQEEKTSDLKTQQRQELQRLEERVQLLLKQKDMVTQEKDLAKKLQHHFESSQMRFRKLQLEQATAQGESPLQGEALQQEPPAETHSQQPLKSGDEVSSSDLVSTVE
ncbi:disks large homolog 5-like [Peromyscus leucopus]|uniref:disks large homolog 5-like n=1 Tax=Peromyscus leucopus TaxID=10041 RepID=UPI0018852FA6|nr:disks large homolog 5-like [Peromyscus leucopus]